ncbi:hypothetical protein [Sediminitomix flava]|uniref:Uncharacterized protein n=1 Tax=Sediminitomix flava TaxID=379075 RepID=A0A315ZE15_SEDFL|nr:hypothetical protein [Sediminitomix flava]PWJ43390.1 hypothetical protein BC781_102951 [Sediminitomix flava]
MKKLAWITLATLFSVGMISCDDDDDDNGNRNNGCTLQELEIVSDGDTVSYMMTYDSLDRIVSVDQNDGIESNTFDYTYNSDGVEQVTLSGPLGNTLVTLDYGYTGGELSSYTLSNSITEDTLEVDVTVNSDGTVNTLTFDTDIEGSNFSVVATYSYDGNGNVESVTATSEVAILGDIEVFSTSFSYDNRDNPLQGIFVDLDDIQSLINNNSPNNITRVEVREADVLNPLDGLALTRTVTFDYDYNSDRLPEDADVTDTDEDSGDSEESEWIYSYECE